MLDAGGSTPVTLGDTIRLGVQCRNTSFVATSPDAAPSWSIYLINGGDDTEILTGTLGASDADSKTGYRTGNAAITVGNGFAAGNIYRIRFAYAITSAFVNTEVFQVI